MHVCFCCACYRFSVLSQEISWEFFPEMIYFVSGGMQNRNSINHFQASGRKWQPKMTFVF